MCSQLQSLTLNGVYIATTWDWNEVGFDHNTANSRVIQRQHLSCRVLSVCVCSMLEAQLWLLVAVGLCNSVESKYLG